MPPPFPPFRSPGVCGIGATPSPLLPPRHLVPLTPPPPKAAAAAVYRSRQMDFWSRHERDGTHTPLLSVDTEGRFAGCGFEVPDFVVGSEKMVMTK